MSEFIPKSELKLMFKSVDDKIETYHKEVMVELKQHRETHTEMLEQVKKTNGKVKKITLALVAVAAFAIGSGGTNVMAIMKLFL